MKPPAVFWLRLEGVAVLISAMLAYEYFALPWRWFLICFLLPDASMLGYLISARVGSWAYNFAHTYTLALIVTMAGLLTNLFGIFATGLILCAHIGFDRALGYGLKSPEGFRITHLGPIGRDRVTRKK